MSPYDPATGHNYRWTWLRHAALRRPVMALVFPLAVVVACIGGAWERVETLLSEYRSVW